jgi:hypothetical protein
MVSSSDYLLDLRQLGGTYRGVGFDLVVAARFYDGPEDGFAFYRSGEGVKFSAVAESKYPILRAFEIVLLDGNWQEMVRNITSTSTRGPYGWMAFSSRADRAISLLEDSVRGAVEHSYYVGVGRAYLNGLAVSAISKNELDALKTPTGGRNAYLELHRYIKEESERHGVKIYNSQES